MVDERDDSTFLDFMKDEVQVVEGEMRPAISSLLYYDINKLNEISKLSENLIIDSKESADAALRLSSKAKVIFKNAEEFRKKKLQPYRDLISMVNEYAANLKKTLDAIDGTLKVKLAAWQAIQQKRALEAQESIKEFSETLGLDIAIHAPKAPETASCEAATAYTRDKVTFEIEDAMLVPDEYWVIDEKAIQKHIDLGKRDIPGVKIKIEKVMTIRRK